MTTATKTTKTTNSMKSKTTVEFRTDEYYANLFIGRHGIAWRYSGVTNCCAFAMVHGILINGNSGDSYTAMGKGWDDIHAMLKADEGLYKAIIHELKESHDPRQFIANWVGLGSLVFMNLNNPSTPIKGFNKFFLKLWKDAWGVEWNKVACGVSRYKTDWGREYGIDAYLWENIPHPRSAEEKERVPDVGDYEYYEEDDYRAGE